MKAAITSQKSVALYRIKSCVRKMKSFLKLIGETLQ